MDVLAEEPREDYEVRFLPLYSPEAEAYGAEVAPALVVNRKLLVEGIPSVEEIKALIQKARPISLGIILTKSPAGSEEAENALDTALESLAIGNRVGLFLLSDGVWLAKGGQMGPVAARLTDMIERGGEVLCSGEHLKAAGLTSDRLAPGVAVADDGFGRLVELIMEEWDKVITF